MYSVSIGNLQLSNCIYNAACYAVKTHNGLKQLNNSYSGAVVTKTLTPKPREGNLRPNYHADTIGSINSVGLANDGYQYFIDPPIDFNKPYIISVTANSIKELMELLKVLKKRAINIELNLSCPNTEKDPICYDFDKMDEWLGCVSQIYTSFGLKLSPYFLNRDINRVVNIIKKYPQIVYLVCCNTIPNGLIINPETDEPIIGNKFGGVGGKYAKPFALANVSKFYTLLGNQLDIVGCGGISSGLDVYHYVLAGAKAVQISTQFIEEGSECFKRITTEFKRILKIKKYADLKSFTGKL